MRRGTEERTQLFEKMVTILGSRDIAESWLARQAIGLNSQRPIDLISTKHGRKMVESYLDQLEHGVYV